MDDVTLFPPAAESPVPWDSASFFGILPWVYELLTGATYV